MTTWSTLLLCARLELTLAVRSRWTQLFAGAFAGLSLAVAGAGYIVSGGSGIQDFARTATSMTGLIAFLIPMMALLIGTMALTPDHGAAELLFSQPVSRAVVLCGRWLGLFQALVAAQALGFGAAGLVIFSQSGTEGIGAFGLLFGSSVVLTAVFLSVAALLASGVGARRRSRALALAILIWFVTVVLADVVALGIASLLGSTAASRVLIWTTLANPVDAARTGALLGIQGTSAFGAASLALLRFAHGWVGVACAIGASLGLWIGVPAAVAAVRLSRADI